MSEELLTIAQAAQHLHVSERTLRRVLRQPELQAKLVAINRHIRGRDRLVRLVDSALIDVLHERYFGSYQEVKQQAATGITPSDVAQVYERLLTEQAARIADLQAALVHERRLSQRLADALAEAQERRAAPMPPPEPPPFWHLFSSRRSRRPR